VRQFTVHQEPVAVPAVTKLEQDTAALLATCEEKLAKDRAALEADIDPETVGEWISPESTKSEPR
jgi:hypothetical protein